MTNHNTTCIHFHWVRDLQEQALKSRLALGKGFTNVDYSLFSVYFIYFPVTEQGVDVLFAMKGTLIDFISSQQN